MAKLIKSSITLAERMHDAVAFTNGENIWLHHNLGRHYASIALLRPTKSNSPQERVAVCQPASYAQGGRQVGSTGDTHAAEAAAGTLLGLSTISAGRAHPPSHQASPHGLASRGLFSLADNRCRRGPRYPVILANATVSGGPEVADQWEGLYRDEVPSW